MTAILVIGKQGQLATCLRERGPSSGVKVINTDRKSLDLANPERVPEQLAAFEPDAIINAAAYTAVDQAESEEDLANQINGHSPGHIAEFARERDIPFLHVSTDYVFAGDKQGPYLETDPTGPTGAYGRSKLIGEQSILAANPSALIFRTAWVYSAIGKNFLLTMLKVGESRDELTVVEDQIGNPTSAADLAEALLTIASQLLEREDRHSLGGIYHLAGTGETSWAGFASAIFGEAVKHGHPGAKVTGIPSSEYPTPTKRPENSRLDCGKARQVFGVAMPDWQESTARTVSEYYQDQ